MENLKKYITDKNLLIVQAVSMGVTVILSVLILNLIGNINKVVESFDFSGLSSLVGSISTACLLFYLAFFLVLILVVAIGIKVFIMNDKRKECMANLITNGICLIIGFISLGTINQVSQIASSFSQGADSFMSSLFGMSSQDVSELSNLLNLKVPMILFILLQIVSCVIAYFLYKNKSSEAENADIKVYKEKFDNYIKDEKKKRNLIIAAVIAGVLIVGIGGFSVYQANKKTPVDLVSACNVTFDGYDGYGTAEFSCENQDDLEDNSSLNEFLDSVSYSLSKDSDLSNGDKVKLEAEYSQEYADEMKVGVTNYSKSYEVEGLNKVYSSWDMIDEEDQTMLLDAMEPAIYDYFEELTGTSFTYTVNSVTRIADLYKFDTHDKSGELRTVFKVEFTKTGNILDNSTDFTEYFTVNTSSVSPGEDGKGVADGWEELNVSTMYTVDNDTKAKEYYLDDYFDYEEVK